MSSTVDTDFAVAEIVTADRDHVLHAFASLGQVAEPGPIFREARGIQLVDVDGNVWLDGMAGLANVSLGYGRDELADVAATAMKQLSFGTTFFNHRGHVPGHGSGRSSVRSRRPDLITSSTVSAGPMRSRRRSSSRATSTP